MEQSEPESEEHGGPWAESSTQDVCPYCGSVCADASKCSTCAGLFDPLSRQATQNAMGPWYIRDDGEPFHPGCSYETLREMILKGRVIGSTVIRGPTTRQFWTHAKRVPSVANLLGSCHNCQARVSPDEYMCGACGAVFSPEADRQHLGLAPVHLLPGQASPEIVAASTIGPVVSAQSGRLAGEASCELSVSLLDQTVLKRTVIRQRHVIFGLGTGVLVLVIVLGLMLFGG